MDAASEPVRVDRWLCAARIFKSRTVAQDACAAGHVKVNDRTVKASQLLRSGDRVEADAPRGKVVLVVLGLSEKRLSPPEARELYEDHSPPPVPRDPALGVRERGAGRPTKADRRKIDRLRWRNE
jgi:ribosome-associated heat shock protein Hsp15